MTFYFEQHSEAEGWETKRVFKTLRGATSHGCAVLRAYGYLRADRHETGRHIVAEWKGPRGNVIARVWQ